MSQTDASEITGEAAPQDVPVSNAEQKKLSRKWLIVIVGVLAVLVAYLLLAWSVADRVPRATTVAGIEIGGLSSAEAIAVLKTGTVEVTAEPVTVVVDQVEGEFLPEDAGLSFDIEGTVDSLVGFTVSPVRLWQNLMGLGAVAPLSQVNESELEKILLGMADSFAVLPLDGNIRFDGTTPVAESAETGFELDVPAAVNTVSDEWLTGPSPLPLPTSETTPAISDAEVERAIIEEAKPLVAAPVKIIAGDGSAELSADALAEAASFTATGPTLGLNLNGELLAEAVRQSIPELETAPVDATITIGESGPVITPHTVGAKVDTELLSTKIIEATHTESRTAEISFTEVDAEITTADAEALGVKERISEFSTTLTYDSVRTGNLITGAAAVNGILVMPGETFSLLETLDPITEENGYGNAGVLVDGAIVDGIGGGLSQLATTIYNAVFFAGLEDVEHQPHTQYIPRYPEGREATIADPSIDLKFKNDTDYGVLIESWVSDNQIHVTFWGTKIWDIYAETSPRSEVVQPRTVKSNRAGCVPAAAGEPGFLVTVTRNFYQNDEYVKSESQGWRYQPVNAITCR